MQWPYRDAPVIQLSGQKSLKVRFFPFELILLKLVLQAEAVAQRCFVKKMFLEISQNSQENTSARVSFFNKVADSGTDVFLWILQNF